MEIEIERENTVEFEEATNVACNFVKRRKKVKPTEFSDDRRWTIKLHGVVYTGMIISHLSISSRRICSRHVFVH